jgi:hypothetical protein
MKIFPYIFSILFCSLSFFGQAQKSYWIPKEYNILKDYNNKDIRFDSDFDKDGTNDVVAVCVNKTDDSRNVLVFLSSRYFSEEIYFWFPTEQDYFDFNFSNDILSINGSAGKFEEKIKLKYFSDLEDMRLIRYEYKYVGNLYDSPSSTVVDLLSNQYSKDILRKKTSFNIVTLSNIEVFLDYFNKNGW